MSDKIIPFGTAVPIGSDTPNHTILVKFFFTNPKHLPNLPDQPVDGRKKAPAYIAGGEVFTRPDNTTMDNLHARDAHTAGIGFLAKPGRVREDRVDTGRHFIDNVHQIHAGFVTRGLVNTGYQLTACHWFLQKGQYASQNKWVAVLAFSRDGEALKLPNDAIDQRRALANTCWRWCHGWANEDGVITLNFGGRQPDAQPQNTVIVRDWKITAATVGSFVKEKEETPALTTV